MKKQAISTKYITIENSNRSNRKELLLINPAVGNDLI